MILESAILDVIPGKEKEFHAAFEQASPIIAGMKGYVSHQYRKRKSIYLTRQLGDT